MNHSNKLFTISGISLKLHYSWYFIIALLWYSLSVGFFPASFPGYSTSNYVLMGGISSLLLFVSVVLHEFSHSLVAKANNIQVKEITLFFFGGVTNISTERIKAKTEFWMALAGPLLSIYLGILFFFIAQFTINIPLLYPILSYTFQINLVLGIFNLLPGYPLDGGRILRAIIHGYTKDLVKATYIASRAGKFLAGVMIFFGIFGFFVGLNLIWFLILGLFLYYVAGASYQQTVILEVLSKVKIRKLIRKNYPKTTPETKITNLIRNIDNQWVIVEKAGNLYGMADLDDLLKIPKKKWKNLKVKDITKKVSSINENAQASKAFELIAQSPFPFLPVVSKNKVKGIVTINSLMNFIRFRPLSK